VTTLSDVDIRAHIARGELVRNSTPTQVGPACYELRMGTVYYDLTEGDRRIDASASGTVLIKPGHRVVLISLEELVVPDNMIARVSSKGSLFSVGLSAVSTYADPGFSGNIGVVTQNLSDKYIELPVGESIAKVDFSFLSSSSAKPYRGQHGFQTQIWPIRHQLQKSHGEVKQDSRVESEEAEAFKILPLATSTALRRIQKRETITNIALLLAVLVNGLVLAAVSTKFFDTVAAIAINLVSTAIVGAIMFFTRQKA
jgi:dCTP deaminase